MNTAGFGLVGSFFGVKDEPMRVWPQQYIDQ